MKDEIKEIELENKLTAEELVNLLNQELIRQRNEYKSRNEKAIEYAHNHQPVFELSSKEQIQEWFEKEYYVELLNILQGDDKE